ncbi:MAG: hypothetical protein PWQ57_143 [Desulfovibrionales bacterium]|jgi:hypothetical protein|nr:hypothetical protein [Desulfovibrionales bacterium]
MLHSYTSDESKLFLRVADSLSYFSHSIASNNFRHHVKDIVGDDVGADGSGALVLINSSRLKKWVENGTGGLVSSDA